jgi:hypothetical protein
MQHLPERFKRATATKRGKIITFTLLALVISGIAGGIFYWNLHKKQIIRGELEHALRKKTGGLYVLNYDSLRLDEIAGDLSVKNIRLVYDSAKFAAQLASGDAPPLLVQVTIPSLEVSGVKTPRALLENEILGKKIHIRDPEIEIIYTNAGKDSMRNIPTREVYEQILGNLTRIKVDTVEISNAVVTTRTMKTGKVNLSVKSMSLLLRDVAIDSIANEDSSRLLFSKNVNLRAASIWWPSADKLYHYSSDNIEIDSDARTVKAGNFSMIPQLGEAAFVNSFKFQKDRFDFLLKDIHLQSLDMTELFNERIIADSLYVGNAQFKIYRDNLKPHDTRSRVGKYPQQVLEKLPVDINVIHAWLPNCFVEYKERNPRSKQAGKIQFRNTSARLSNLTNMKNVIAKNNLLEADVTSRFLGKASFNVNWKFYLGDAKGKFKISGTLGPMGLKDANPVIVPLGPAKIEDGKLDKLEFKLAGNDYRIDGRVEMLYKDLKVSVLELDKGAKELDRKSLTSLVANFIIKNDNPVKDKEDPRVAEVAMDRDPQRSVFHLVWKAIFKGIKETAGIKK